MEIHPPHGPIKSLREFAVHLLTITIGILIALGLEGLLQWQHHRTLVHEAEANIAAEIQGNAGQLKIGRNDLQDSETQLERMVDVIHRMERDRKARTDQVIFNWTVIELHQTSWATAGATGAVAYMGYGEANRYTRIYDLQEEYMSLQRRAFESSLGVQALATLLGRDSRTLSDAELSHAEGAVGLALANARALEKVGQVLARQYERFQPRP